MAGVDNGVSRKQITTTGDKVKRVLGLEDTSPKYIGKAFNNFCSEMFGTGLLVFLGCMGCHKGFGQANDHTGIALSFALAVFLAIQICCHNSGGHVNPALTVCSLFFKRLTPAMALVYIAGQCVGSILGFGLLKAITPAEGADTGYEGGLCTTVPNQILSDFQVFLAEFILTSVLMLIVCSIWDPRNAQLHDSATLKFGFAIFSLAYAGVPYTGCSMNPARSLGPAVWNNSWKQHWIFWVAPLLAGAFSGAIYTNFFCGPIIPPKPSPSQNPPTQKDPKVIDMEAVTSVSS